MGPNLQEMLHICSLRNYKSLIMLQNCGTDTAPFWNFHVGNAVVPIHFICYLITLHVCYPTQSTGQVEVENPS